MVDVLMIIAALLILGVVYLAAHFLDMQRIYHAHAGKPVPNGKKEWTHPFILNTLEYGRLKSRHYLVVRAFGDGLSSEGILDKGVCLFTKFAKHSPIVGKIHHGDVILIREKENKKLFIRQVANLTDDGVSAIIHGRLTENIQTNVDLEKYDIIGILKKSFSF